MNLRNKLISLLGGCQRPHIDDPEAFNEAYDREFAKRIQTMRNEFESRQAEAMIAAQEQSG